MHTVQIELLTMPLSTVSTKTQAGWDLFDDILCFNNEWNSRFYHLIRTFLIVQSIIGIVHKLKNWDCPLFLLSFVRYS